jgi:hypothetical protein
LLKRQGLLLPLLIHQLVILGYIARPEQLFVQVMT